MRRGTLLLQLTALVLLVGLTGLIVGSKYLVSGTREGGSARPSAARREPDKEIRLFHARHGACLLVLAPLDPAPARRERERRWLDRVLGVARGTSTYLYLHLFHLGTTGAFTFDPGRDRVVVEGEGAGRVENRPFQADLEKRVSSPSDRLHLGAVVPPGPVTLGPGAGGAVFTRILLRFPAALPWERISAARFRRGRRALDFRAATLTRVEWESVLAGGALPAAFEAGAVETAAERQ